MFRTLASLFAELLKITLREPPSPPHPLALVKTPAGKVWWGGGGGPPAIKSSRGVFTDYSGPIDRKYCSPFCLRELTQQFSNPLTRFRRHPSPPAESRRGRTSAGSVTDPSFLHRSDPPDEIIVAVFAYVRDFLSGDSSPSGRRNGLFASSELLQRLKKPNRVTLRTLREVRDTNRDLTCPAKPNICVQFELIKTNTRNG